MTSAMGRVSVETSSGLLLYGRDGGLLETRKWVLTRARYCVWTAHDLSQVACLISQDQVSVLVLCHTLSTEECGRAIAVASSKLPNLKSLTLTTGKSGDRDCISTQQLHAMDGPAELISAVAKLVDSENTTYSHTW
jgi:hypothetical protein